MALVSLTANIKAQTIRFHRACGADRRTSLQIPFTFRLRSLTPLAHTYSIARSLAPTLAPAHSLWYSTHHISDFYFALNADTLYHIVSTLISHGRSDWPDYEHPINPFRLNRSYLVGVWISNSKTGFIGGVSGVQCRHNKPVSTGVPQSTEAPSTSQFHS
jgi:hypothetical protein